MNSFFRNLSMGFILLAAISCSDTPTEPSSQTPSETSAEKESTEQELENHPSSFKVKTGEMVKVPLLGLQVALKSVTDSRCPADVVCITAGEALTTIKVVSWPDNSQEKELSLCLGCREVNDSLEFLADNQKYLIILKEVTPYPYVNQPETLENKTAEFLVYSAE